MWPLAAGRPSSVSARWSARSRTCRRRRQRAAEAPQTNAEATAVNAIEKLGGRITRNGKLPGKPVIEVDLRSTKVTDAALKHLAELKNLQTLDLRGTQVTDAGLQDLAAFKNLTSLDLFATGVTQAGGAALRKELPKCDISRRC